MKTKLSFPALAASAVCGLTLCALRLTLSYLFRDVEESQAAEKSQAAKESKTDPSADTGMQATAEAKPSFAR